jgi:hypothetical protein
MSEHTRQWMIVFRSKTGQLMRYQGRKFSNKGKALRFSTIDHAMRVARGLMRKFPGALTKGTLFIEKMRAPNMTELKKNPRKLVDITARVLANRKRIEKEHLDAGLLVPIPTSGESKALRGIKVYETRYKKNPGFRSAVDRYARELDEADERLAGFSGRTGKTVLSVQPPQIRAGLVIGKLEGVMYATTRDGERERYLHRFSRNSQPLLIASHDGKQIGIVGGRYQFTDAGIEDE